MKSKHHCPSCQQLLTLEELPPRSKTVPKPYFQVFCGNPRCPSDAAQKDGGSGDTEGHAYLSLCNAIDNETENECDPEAQKDRNEWAKAEHASDLAKS